MVGALVQFVVGHEIYHIQLGTLKYCQYNYGGNGSSRSSVTYW